MITVNDLIACISDISLWMTQNFLQLNQKLRETNCQNYLKSFALNTKEQVKNLDVIIDSDLHFECHIRNVSSVWKVFYHLRNIAKVSPFFTQADTEKLVHAFISSRLDYCNALLSCVTKKAIHKLQLVQNAAAPDREPTLLQS